MRVVGTLWRVLPFFVGRVTRELSGTVLEVALPYRLRAMIFGLLVVAGACARTDALVATTSTAVEQPSTTADKPETTNGRPETSTAPSTQTPPPTRPDWLGQRPLPTNEAGFGVAGPTPAELVDRRIPTIDTLPSPATDEFASSIEPLAGDPLARSTWHEGCPVAVVDLRYVLVTFRGFDGLAHTGELIVAASVAEDIVGVFAQLWEADFPLEEMRVVTKADLDAEPTGDGNNTGSFVCRPVTGGSSYSQHAYGLAIDVNSFHNPYVKGSLVLPELAGAYVDRSDHRPGMLADGDVVVEAFAAIGWQWGGHWTTLKDWQHFSQNGR